MFMPHDVGRLTKGGQPRLGNRRGAADVGIRARGERQMSRADAPAIVRIIANTINETARGDPNALAARIVAALGEAGYRIVSANGMEDAALGSQPEKYGMEQLYRSPNGDTWFLARDPTTGSAFVRHQANTPSGGQVTDIELDAFLSGARNPEHEALLRLIGASILNPRGTKADDEPLAVNTGREWSNAEMNALGEMLVRGVSIDEIARRLRRDHGEVCDKVAEVGRASRKAEC
jgi:hypothetical protein